MKGMLGLDPLALAQARQASDLKTAVDSQGQGMFSGMGIQGSMFNQQLARNLGNDPEMKKAQDFQRIKQKVAQIAQPGTLEHFAALAQELNAAGYPDTAAEAMAKVQEMQATVDKAEIEKRKIKVDEGKLAVDQAAENRLANDVKTKVVEVDGRVRLVTDTGEVVADLGNAPDKRNNINVELKPGDVNSIGKLSSGFEVRNKVMGTSMGDLEKVRMLKTNYNLAAKGNEVAIATLKKSIIALYESGNQSNQDFIRALGQGSIIEDIEGFVTQFFSGDLTKDKLSKLGKMIKAMDSTLRVPYEKKREMFNASITTAGDITPEIRNTLKVEPWDSSPGKKEQSKDKGSGTSISPKGTPKVMETSTNTPYRILEP